MDVNDQLYSQYISLNYLYLEPQVSNTLIFLYLLWFLIVNTSIIVVFTAHPIHSILALIAVFIEVGVLLLFLGLEYIAFVFLVVYVGAIAVLFLFVTMMLNIRQLEFNISVLAYLPATIFIALSFFVNFIVLFFKGKINFSFSSNKYNDGHLYAGHYRIMQPKIIERYDFHRFKFERHTVYIEPSGSLLALKDVWLSPYNLYRSLRKVKHAPIFDKRGYLPPHLIDYSLPTKINVADIFYALTNIESIGHCLYTYFYIAFLASGVVLLVAMIGSISLTLYHKSNIKRQSIDKQWLRDFIVVLKK